MARRSGRGRLSPLEEELLGGEVTFAGVDECGRGPLAGPVVAAAVIWDYGHAPEGITDSKLLQPEERRELFSYILHSARSVAVGWSSPAEIDRINILWASMQAMGRAVSSLDIVPSEVLVDGNRESPYIEEVQRTIIGGDGKVVAISAASIVAKCARDRLMMNLDSSYPGYGFRHNYGYPTPEHFRALRKLGPTLIHRRSFNGVCGERS